MQQREGTGYPTRGPQPQIRGACFFFETALSANLCLLLLLDLDLLALELLRLDFEFGRLLISQLVASAKLSPGVSRFSCCVVR